jgi:hypothetical protein
MDWSWVGPAIGAVGGYLNSRNNTPTQTTTQQIPAALQPLLGGVAQRGMEIGNMPFNPYPYNQVADFNPYQFGAMDQIAGQAGGPQTTLQNANTSLGDTLGGKYLGDQNPYLNNMVNQTAQDVMGRINGSAFNSGSFGNAGVAQAAAQGLGNAENSLRYGAYNDERNRMQGALGAVPSITSAQYIPGQQMMGIGNQVQQQGQNLINANYNQWQQAQQWPFQTYNAMLGAFGHNVGSTTSTTQPQSPFAGALGGAMFGNSMQNSWNGQQQQSPPPSWYQGQAPGAQQGGF